MSNMATEILTTKFERSASAVKGTRTALTGAVPLCPPLLNIIYALRSRTYHSKKIS